ncbi:hypothetical protein QQ020_34885 [Fulvivirgaceae bacterium BMA12]|uniref:Lipoprotein n=1 Tax=Agaribacillus aureus TaxID=3051825 RepID=A0ABT8LHQ3_9BACT|nr:hypothetical protein [Fulvivirgaceae bacterium BMA12]
MRFQKLHFILYAKISFIALLTITSCSSEDDGDPGPQISIPKYSVLASVGDQEYLTTSDDLSSGKISIVGQGLETNSFGSAVTKDGYTYLNNFNESTVDQYQVTENGWEKINSISIAPLSPSGSFRLMQITGDNTLLLTNWPDDNGDCPYAIVSLPSFTVASNGSFNIPDVKGFDPVEIGGLVKDGKIYLGTMYSNVGTWDSFPDSLITWKLDYPSFTNPEMIVSTASLGTVAGFTGPSSLVDEKGDIYQQNIRSKHWYNMGTREEMPTVFVRIRDGEYDDSYVFNVSEKFGGTVSLIGIQYVGNGIAYGKLLDEDATNEWGDAWANNYTSIVKIDLYNKTITKLNIPQGPFIAIREGIVENGKLYLPISPVGQTAHIYEITIGGGADDFVKGAELDGNNVVANAIFKNE